MAQEISSNRMDETLEPEFDRLCQDFDTSASAITRESAIQAFEALRTHAQTNGLSDLSLDEINAEIAAARRDLDEKLTSE